MQEKRMPVMRNLKMKKSKLDSEDVNKRTEKSNMSPTSLLIKKRDCLCSPTTHAGSSRCRHHRTEGFRRAGFDDSDLSNVASKS